MKFILIVEGEAEKKSIQPFLIKGLNQKLTTRVGIKPILKPSGKFEDAYRKLVKNLLQNEVDDIIGIIGLADLYGSGWDYEGKYQGYETLFRSQKERIEKAVNNEKYFRMFFAVHEFEAWLFSQPAVFPDEIRDKFEKFNEKPEKVDFDKHPSSRINEVYQNRFKKNYKKTIDGPDLFQGLDPQVVYDKCPHFRQLMDTMLEMAQKAGIS